jgi:hypothetical protein
MLKMNPADLLLWDPMVITHAIDMVPVGRFGLAWCTAPCCGSMAPAFMPRCSGCRSCT